MKKRVAYIDAAKGIGILLVVIGHAITKEMAAHSMLLHCLRTVIYTVHMPLFFMIAGYLFFWNEEKYRQSNQARLIAGKAKTYMIPYVSFSVIAYVLFSVLNSIDVLKGVAAKTGYQPRNIGRFLVSLITCENPVDDHLWFVYVMFLIWLIALLLVRFMSCRNRAAVSAVLCVLSIVVPWPDLIMKVLRYSFAFFMGGLAAQTDVFERMKKRDAGILFLIFAAFVSVLCIGIPGESKALRCIILPTAQISGSACILWLSRRICGKNGRFAGSIVEMGKKSYPIYLFHQPFIVNGSVFVAGAMGFPVPAVIVAASVAGIIVPMALDRMVVQKSRLLQFVLLGGHQ